jgi:hypothetical protein
MSRSAQTTEQPEKTLVAVSLGDRRNGDFAGFMVPSRWARKCGLSERGVAVVKEGGVIYISLVIADLKRFEATGITLRLSGTRKQIPFQIDPQRSKTAPLKAEVKVHAKPGTLVRFELSY